MRARSIDEVRPGPIPESQLWPLEVTVSYYFRSIHPISREATCHKIGPSGRHSGELVAQSRRIIRTSPGGPAPGSPCPLDRPTPASLTPRRKTCTSIHVTMCASRRAGK